MLRLDQVVCAAVVVCAVLVFRADAADAGELHDINELTVRAAHMKDLPPEEVLALAESGDADAQLRLGRKAYYGDGYTPDYETAFRWLVPAAKHGLMQAQRYLGMMYEGGRGVEADPAEAARWYEKSARQGDVTAQLDLGLLYQSGKGVEQDDAEAFIWFALAASGGDQGPAGMRDVQARKLPPSDLAEAEARLATMRREIPVVSPIVYH